MNDPLARAGREPRAREPRAEAAAIYAALFGGVVPERLAERYERAVVALPLEPDPVPAAPVWASPRRLAAVEYYLRLTRGKNGLTQRFQVLFYLAELERELFPRFARERPARLGALLDLGQAGLAAAVFFGRGLRWWRRGAGA